MKLTEGQDSRRRPPVGPARVWGTSGWLVDEDDVGGPVADAAFRTRGQGAQLGQGTSDLLTSGQMQGQEARRQVTTAAQSAGPPHRVAVRRWLAG